MIRPEAINLGSFYLDIGGKNLSLKDALNSKFALPDMGDYYYDAPDQQKFLEKMNAGINPYSPHDTTSDAAAAYKFYHEDPPMNVGYDKDHMIYMFGVNLHGNNIGSQRDQQSVGKIIVQDGDTIDVDINDMVVPQDGCQELLAALIDKYSGQQSNVGYNSIIGDTVPKVGFRFACIDTMELPHFVACGAASKFSNSDFPTDKIKYKDAIFDSSGDYLVSKYKCFMEDPEMITPKCFDATTSCSGGKFFNYARREDDDVLNIMRVGSSDGNSKWQQYFDRDGIRYLLITDAAPNNYDNDKVADAGLARDICANMISKATEMRVMVNGCTYSRSGAQFTDQLRTDNDSGAVNSAKEFLELFMNDVIYNSAGYNYAGQDLHGRLVAVIYVKVNGQWVNLNKMIKADTDCTLVNTYANNKLISNERSDDYMARLFKSDTYEIDRKRYADDIYQSSAVFDDRKYVQGKIFSSLGKPHKIETLKKWTMTIGDVTMFVPPTSIRCVNQSKSQRFPIVRAKGTMAKSATKAQKIIEMDLYFSGDNGINGYKYETYTGMFYDPTKKETIEKVTKNSKPITYWMNGLRAFIAQFKVAPFLPIDNDYVNNILNVDAVSLLNLSISTVPNFPALIKATIQMSEFEYRIYMPEIPRDNDDAFGVKNYFSKQINYPLLRYYYQRLIRNGEDLKDIPFLSDKFITNTFGQKTCLIPMDFKSSEVRFYIPNKEQLYTLKQLKTSRAQKSSMMSSITQKELDFATDMAKISDATSQLNENASSQIAELNLLLNDEQYNDAILSYNHLTKKFVVLSPNYNETQDKIVSYDSNKYKTLSTKVNDYIEKILQEYVDAVSDLKNINNESLCINTSIEGDYIDNNRKGIFHIADNARSYQEIKTAVIIKVNTPYISDDELRSLKTEATADASFSVDEIFVNREVAIPITVKLANLEEVTSGVAIQYKYGIKLGTYSVDAEDGDKTTFVFSPEGSDARFISFLKEVSATRSVKGNEDANNIKQSIDYIDKNTLKFELYNAKDSLRISNIQMSISNTFSQITLQQTSGYAPQYMGGTDTEIQLTIMTTSQETAAAISALPTISADFAREYRIVLASWPLKIESEITKLMGVTDVLIDTVSIDTVPQMPGLYKITMYLVSVDRSLRNRESMTAKDLQNFHNINVSGSVASRNWTYEQMHTMLAEAQLYPDLELPTLKELDDAGFSFIHYSDKERVYPDPDFYFTYSYILVSQIIRQAVLNMFNSENFISNLELTDTRGHKMNGNILNSMGAWEKNFEAFNKAVEDNYSDPDIRNQVKTLRDFMYGGFAEESKMWSISPELKVAFCEKDFASQSSDGKKIEQKAKEQGKTPAQITAESTNENTIIEAPDKMKTDTEYQNYVMEQKNSFDKQITDVIDKILDTPIATGIDAPIIGSGASQLIKKVAPMFGSGAKSALNDFDTFLDAASDTMTNNGQDYVSQLLSGTDWKRHPNGINGTAIINGSSQVIRTKGEPLDANTMKKLAAIPISLAQVFGLVVPGTVVITSAILSVLRGKINPIKNITETISDSKEIVDEGFETSQFGQAATNLTNLALYGTIFGYFGIRTYTETEMRRLLHDDTFSLDDTTVDANSRCLLDPYYRYADSETVIEYKTKCCTDYDFAKEAFTRICLIYLRDLITADILPSFCYDIFRDSIFKKERMLEVMNAIDATRIKSSVDEVTQSEIAAGGHDKHRDTKDIIAEAKEKNKEELEKQLNSAKATNANVVQQYQDEFSKNCDSLDRGKFFLAICMAITDGNSSLWNILENRDVDTLTAITRNAFTSEKAQKDVDSVVVNKLRTFIRALCGENFLDPNKINGGDGKSIQTQQLEFNDRRNVAAASETPELYLIHSFYDMVTHDCRGRMLRAFPTFYMAMIDEGRLIGRWKLHDNFYNNNSISDITITKSRKIPTDVAEITMSNFFRTFTEEDEDLNMNYTCNYYDVFNSIWWPRLQEYAIQEEEKRTNAQPVERIKLRPGARVHVRIGYGSDANALPIAFNGMIAEVATGSVVKLVCQSDGAELARPILMDRQAYQMQQYDEWFGSKWCTNGATPKTILYSILSCYGGAVNKKIHTSDGLSVFEQLTNQIGMTTNPFGFYHFGSRDIKYCGEIEPAQNIFEVGNIPANCRYGIQKRKQDEDYSLKEHVLMASGALGNMYVQESRTDDVPMLTFKLFGKSFWDILNICQSTAGDYIASIAPFGMRSTIFFGRPHDYYAYDYMIHEGSVCEKRKPFQQYHIYNSLTDIVDNKIAVSSSRVKTCAVGMYTVEGSLGEVPQKTEEQWVDKDIFPEFQKTMYVDTQLYGAASRQAGIISDVINFFTNPITQSSPIGNAVDRNCDDNGSVRSHRHMANYMTRTILKNKIGEMYQGSLVLIGDPTVKPCDRFLIEDNFNEIRGQAIVRDVVQNFSAETGFTTVINPDLIATLATQSQEEYRTHHALQMVGVTAGYATSYAIVFSAEKITKAAGGQIASAMKNLGLTSNTEILKKLADAAEGTFGYIEKTATSAAGKAEKLAGNGKNMAKVLSRASKFSKYAGNGLKFLKLAAKATPWTAIASELLEVSVGALIDVVNEQIESRRVLTLFPLTKYGKVMVGGIDGHQGLVYGSPTFNQEGFIRSVFSDWFSKGSAMGTALDWASSFSSSAEEIFKTANEANKNFMSKIITDNDLSTAAIDAVDKSQLNFFGKTLINPCALRVDLTDKDTKEKVNNMYGISGHTIEDINNDSKMQQMRPVWADSNIKPYYDLGYFRIAAMDKGFDSLGNDINIQCVYIADPTDHTRQSYAVNAIVSSNNDGETCYNIPFLAKDSIGYIAMILKKSFESLAGTEQRRDQAEWYKKNEDSFIVLKSALICGGDNGIDNTGYSFELEVSNDKVAAALEAAYKNFNQNLADNNAKDSRIQKDFVEIKAQNPDYFFVVKPPEENS